MIDRGVSSEYPQFPFAVVRGVPIMLVETFDVHGVSPEPGATLDRIRSLQITPSDLETSSREDVARLIVDSDRFQRLYPDATQRDHMRQVIMQRAK